MTYRFNIADETVAQGVRRIAIGQVDEAVAAIRSDTLAPERVVHEVRRRCKALRALIRLVRPGFSDFERENDAFREIAHALAGARDGKVLVDTLDELADTKADEAGRRLVATLNRRFTQDEAEPERLRATLEQCAGQLLAARERAAGWTLSADGWEALSDGFERTVRSARRAMARLAQADDAECSHDWRKHVKYHWHHMRLLRGAWPHAADERIGQAERLAELLGKRHDFDLFAQTLAALPWLASDAAVIDPLAGEARTRGAKLESKAAKLGVPLFEDKPRKLAAKWGERWRAHDKATAAA